MLAMKYSLPPTNIGTFFAYRLKWDYPLITLVSIRYFIVLKLSDKESFFAQEPWAPVSIKIQRLDGSYVENSDLPLTYKSTFLFPTESKPCMIDFIASSFSSCSERNTMTFLYAIVIFLSYA